MYSTWLVYCTQNDEVLEYDSDKTSENWLENVIGELQFDSAMEVACIYVLGMTW